MPSRPYRDVLAAAAGFARLGASVWALARDDERAGQAARLIRSRTGAAAQALDVLPVGCDLSSLAALPAFTGWFGRQEQRLDVLVNNAGVMPGQRTRTVDGVELTGLFWHDRRPRPVTYLIGAGAR
jgi:dehydrogenase/reductase SDR family member 12